LRHPTGAEERFDGTEEIVVIVGDAQEGRVDGRLDVVAPDGDEDTVRSRFVLLVLVEGDDENAVFGELRVLEQGANFFVSSRSLVEPEVVTVVDVVRG
jgi:hypothetical protein